MRTPVSIAFSVVVENALGFTKEWCQVRGFRFIAGLDTGVEEAGFSIRVALGGMFSWINTNNNNMLDNTLTCKISPILITPHTSQNV